MQGFRNFLLCAVLPLCITAVGSAQGTGPCTADIVENFGTTATGTFFSQALPVTINAVTRLRAVRDTFPNTWGTWRSAPIAGTVKEFTASFRFSVKNGNGTAGDGFSFLWGDLSNSSGTRMSGGEGGIQAFNQDAAGLSVGFVTYAGASANGVNGKWGGTQFVFKPLSFAQVAWTTTTSAVDRTKMAVATVHWSRTTGTRVTITFPGSTSASTIFIDQGAQQLANIDPTGWSFGIAARNGAIDHDLYIAELQINAIVNCPPPSPADINGDCVIDGIDLSSVLSAWGPCTASPCTGDINNNGSVDGSDLTMIISAWGNVGCVPPVASDRHRMRPKGTTTSQQGFWEYLPAGYATRNDWPLLVCLHGIGENGNGSSAELPRLNAHGPTKLITSNLWPVAASTAGDAFVVLSPQNSNGGSGVPLGCHSAADVSAFLQWASANYNVDPSRIYLTGLSCGAIGTWEYIRTFSSNLLPAAFVPICGNGINAFNGLGCLLARQPIWAFHGSADGTIPVSGSTTPITGMQSCSSPPAVDARITVYPGVGHDSWTQTYDLSAGHDIYAWLLTHRRTIP